MIVLKGTTLDVDGGKIKGVYHSEFLSYDKNNGLYIMRLHAKCREEIPDSFIDVAMNVKELTVLSDTNHIKEAYDFAIKISEGYKPFFITLYLIMNLNRILKLLVVLIWIPIWNWTMVVTHVVQKQNQKFIGVGYMIYLA